MRYGSFMNTSTASRIPVGELLRSWRQRRRLTQLDLACDANISTRHMSFLENGRSLPSREMLLHLAERLDVPLRERNALLIAAGYAPVYAQRPLSDPTLQAALEAMNLVLTGHEPYPALVVDRNWHLIAANRMLMPLTIGVAAELLKPPINVLRLSLHPAGLASRIENFTEWRAHLLTRLKHQIDATADRQLIESLEELAAYPQPESNTSASPLNVDPYASVVVPLQLRTDSGVLSLFSTTTVFGTPRDVTLAELAIESFFPADRATTQLLHRIAESIDSPPAA
jgi:transcriptional regulator with XRE-family HTH domain